MARARAALVLVLGLACAPPPEALPPPAPSLPVPPAPPLDPPAPPLDPLAPPATISAGPPEPIAPLPEAPAYGGPPLWFPGFGVEKGKIELPRQVHFRTDSPEILPDSDPVLDRIVRFMKAFPRVTLLRIEAHADNRGQPRHSHELARARSMSVAAWLVAHGVDCRRLLPTAPWHTPPLVCNDCPSGRMPNRRIEFHVALVDDAAPYGPPGMGGRVGDPCKP
jgi:OOP family OmpA-OmpF porin